jgi:hypothetical protein
VRVFVNGTVVLPGALFDQLMADDARALREAVIQDLARILGLPPSSIVIVRLAVGSLIVDFTIAADSVSAAETIADTVRNLPTNDTAVMTSTTAEYRKVDPSAGVLRVSQAQAITDEGNNANVDASGASAFGQLCAIVVVVATVAALFGW